MKPSPSALRAATQSVRDDLLAVRLWLELRHGAPRILVLKCRLAGGPRSYRQVLVGAGDPARDAFERDAECLLTGLGFVRDLATGDTFELRPPSLDGISNHRKMTLLARANAAVEARMKGSALA